MSSKKVKEKVEEKEMTREEYEKMMKDRQDAWEKVINNFKENSEEPITKGEMLKIIDYISEDIGGLAQMAQMMGQNMNALNHNFEKIMSIISGGSGPSVNKTPGGIIIP